MPVYEDADASVRTDQQLADDLERQRLRDMAARLVEAARAGAASRKPAPPPTPFADTALSAPAPVAPDYTAMRNELHNRTAADPLAAIGGGAPAAAQQQAVTPRLKNPNFLQTIGDYVLGLGANPITSLIGRAGGALGLWDTMEERERQLQEETRLLDATKQWIRDNTNYYAQPNLPMWYYEGVGARDNDTGTLMGYAAPPPTGLVGELWSQLTYGDATKPNIVGLPGDTDAYIHEALHALFTENFKANPEKQTQFALDTIKFLGQDPNTLPESEREAWGVAKRWYDQAVVDPESYYGRMTELYAYLGALATQKGLAALPGQVRANYADVFAF
jgi:hypothetical protein